MAGAVVLVGLGLAAAGRPARRGQGELLAAAPHKQAAMLRLAAKAAGAKAVAAAAQGKVQLELRDIEHRLQGTIRQLAPAAKKMALDEEAAPAAEAEAPAAEAEAPAAEAAPAGDDGAAEPAAEEEPAAAEAPAVAVGAAGDATAAPLAASGDLGDCAGQPGGCVGTQRAEREFIPLLIFAIIGAVMLWSYQRFQTYEREPEKPKPPPPRTVAFAPARRVYDTFGAELPPPSHQGLKQSYSSHGTRPAQHVPYYSVPSNV